MLRFTIYHSLSDYHKWSSSTGYMHNVLHLCYYQCLFTGHIALVNITKEHKNKAVINVVVKSNEVIIVLWLYLAKQVSYIYISSFEGIVTIKSYILSYCLQNDECQCLNDLHFVCSLHGAKVAPVPF